MVCVAGVVGGAFNPPRRRGAWISTFDVSHRLSIELEFSLVMALVVRMKKESRQLNLVEQRNAWNFRIFECSREKN